MQFAQGSVVSGYVIERELGSGGMGTVYLARHPRLDRFDALKVLSAERSGDAGFRSGFFREAEIAARLQHPNLVTIHDRGEQDGRLWIAMQYIAGTDLAGLLRQGPLDIERALRILDETAAGLDEIHRAGLLHRDVKPANILIAASNGGAERVLVTDFGIARAADDSATLSAHGTVGTLAYAAPEQLAGDTVDHRADVYALGCTLYQMLTGTVPFRREGAGAIIYAHLHDPPPLVSQHDSALPKALDRVIASAMAKQPGDRFESCGAFAAAARDAVYGRARTPARSRRPWLLGAAIIALVAAVTVAAALVTSRDDGAGARKFLAVDPASVDPDRWGVYGYIAELFPRLLPPSQIGAGYQELSICQPMDEGDHQISLFTTVAEVRMVCLGNRDPVEGVDVVCRTDRKAILPGPLLDTVEGDESWQRSSGSGHVFWGHSLDSADFISHPLGQPIGFLEVLFEDSYRNFCRIQVVGGTGGAELRDRWWRDAPL
ncbi:serine/threonine-protein kinase [Nocardia sp. NPDC056000]|uniref:serine/threonine-protein kinase n=1 Tax=Nocardia sp. NPDC056000 TaxID=3345674 RepID=UPI0035D86E55